MSIQDLEKVGLRQIQNMQRKQARELSHLTDSHENIKAELKKSNDIELVDLQNENIRQVASENEKKEQVLEQMKSHLDRTSRMTDKEIKDLKVSSAKVKQTEQQKLSADRDRIKSENDLYLEELNYRLSKEYKSTVADNEEQIKLLKDTKAQEVFVTKNNFQDKLNTQTQAFTQRFQTDSQNQKKMKDDLDKQYKNERISTNYRQQNEMAKLTNTHAQSLEVRDKEFRKGLKSQDVVFEKKYVDTLKTRNQELNTLEDLNTKVLTKMKSDLKETLMASVNRSDDPFYRFTQLNPSLKQFEDRVEISLPVPDHAKSDIQLTIHGKEAIIAFNRRYEDSRKENGTTNKLNKVESFTTRVPTNHFLDAKSVKSKYESGVITYTINKA